MTSLLPASGTNSNETFVVDGSAGADSCGGGDLSAGACSFGHSGAAGGYARSDAGAASRVTSYTDSELRDISFAYHRNVMKTWIIATLLIASAAVAQQNQNQYEPANAPGAGQKLLAQFAGDWEVVKTFFSRDGKQIVTKGSCKQYMVQDGKFLQSDFTFINPDGTKSTGTGISGFDSKTNRFTTVWFDSRQTTMSIRQSDGTFDGKNIVLWATPLDPDHPGRKTVVRAHLEEDGHLLLYRHFLIDDKGGERVIFEMRMTRHSGSSHT